VSSPFRGATTRRPALVGAGAVAAACIVFAVAHAAVAHEPFQITTEARALPSGLLLHVTLASRTATLACPSAVGAVRSLTSLDIERFRSGLDGCSRGLYVIRSAGRVLDPLAVVLRVTDEGDLDARLRYPAAAPGALTFDAVHLARLPDAMYGAELTVTSERDFLGQALLRASAPELTVHVPHGGTRTASAPRRLSPFAIGGLVVFAGLVAVAVAALVWRRRGPR
jgi:hypothetical protein